MQNSAINLKRAYRRHDIEFKRRLVAMCCEHGVSVAAIAREHGVNANLLFTWRKQAGLGKPAATVLLPVQLKADEDLIHLAGAVPHSNSGNGGHGGTIEIDVAGARVLLGGSVDETILCRVLRALRQSA